VASVCGYYFGHPDSTYFPITTIGPDQLADYAKRKDLSLAEAKKWLAPLL
jgi:5-methyltetrahydrofolate--homocysteine methyltransferase